MNNKIDSKHNENRTAIDKPTTLYVSPKTIISTNKETILVNDARPTFVD